MSNDEHGNELFLVLVAGAQRALHAFILKLVAGMADADDILQETNLVLWSKRADFSPGTNFLAWAFRIARYQVMAFRKRQSLDRLVFGDALIERLADLTEGSCEILDEKREMLELCLRRLSDSQRQLLGNRYAEQLSGREIAEKSGRAIDAVFQSLHRVRQTLLECIEQRLAEQRRRERSDG